jgi:Flp pilus assembly protein CpaB
MKKVYLIAVIVALIAGFATFLFANELSERSSFMDAKKTTVVTAIADVPQNVTITADNFATYFAEQEYIDSYVLNGAITSGQDALNTVTRYAVFRGEQLTSNKLITSDSEDATLSLTIPEGYVAYPIAASGTNAADGYIAVGDKVDIYVYQGMTNLEVFKVSNNTANKTAEANNSEITDYSTLTFIVTEAQAQQLFEIENGGAKYKLVLKPRVSGGSSVDITPEG